MTFDDLMKLDPATIQIMRSSTVVGPNRQGDRSAEERAVCQFCKDCTRCTGCMECTLCTDCTDGTKCDGCRGCTRRTDCGVCTDCYGCYGCMDCTDCVRCSYCWGLTEGRDLRYVVLGTPLTPNQWSRFLKKMGALVRVYEL